MSSSKFLDISTQLPKPMRQRVNLVGVELEGGWDKLPPETKLTHDGSVVFRGDKPIKHVGELPSPPIEVEKIEPWMKTFYPQFVNDTCGLHVHMSFKKALTYQQLMDPSFQATIFEFIARWAKGENVPSTHPIWKRLNGSSQYCTNQFHADAQARATSKRVQDASGTASRYTAINYCYKLHNTLECRLLPMFDDWQQAYRAVMEVLRITNAYLVVRAAREEPVNVAIAADGSDGVAEEIIECA